MFSMENKRFLIFLTNMILGFFLGILLWLLFYLQFFR